MSTVVKRKQLAGSRPNLFPCFSIKSHKRKLIRS